MCYCCRQETVGLHSVIGREAAEAYGVLSCLLVVYSAAGWLGGRVELTGENKRHGIEKEEFESLAWTRTSNMEMRRS